VLLSHFPGIPHNEVRLVNVGAVSVICFYFISGFLMRKSYKRFMAHSNFPVLDFYIDRSIKLFPQYITVVLITFICVVYFGKPEEDVALNQDIGFLKLLLNICLIPTNYIFYPLIIDALKPHLIIPVAWSLALEFHFYLLLPFIFLLKKTYWMLLLLISMGILFSSFFFSTGYFNSQNFGYNYIFGMLTIFLYGYAFSENENKFYKVISLSIWLTFVVFLFVILPAFNLWKNPMVQEVLLGGFIAIPLGYLFTSTIVKSELLSKIDFFLGNLAYPIFISHVLSFYLVEKILGIQTTSDRAYFYIASIIFCFIISLLLHQLQKWVEKYRIKRRGFRSLRDKKTNL